MNSDEMLKTRIFRCSLIIRILYVNKLIFSSISYIKLIIINCFYLNKNS